MDAHSPDFVALARDRDERLARLDAYLDTLASNPILRDPDLELIATAPAATCAGAVNLIEAVRAAEVAA
ncbi:MAG: hypothetical protein JWR51_4665 [Devosia sp.]|nr:hypothetical protein [Devosia sp.]